MNTTPYIQVEVHFKPTASGGRATPANLTTGNYRPHFIVEPRRLLGVVFVKALVPALKPGETTVATAALIYPGVDYSALVPGAVFDIVEGAAVIGTGRFVPSQ
jgi:translation elongation factor EF-Tu-like GTPase